MRFNPQMDNYKRTKSTEKVYPRTDSWFLWWRLRGQILFTSRDQSEFFVLPLRMCQERDGNLKRLKGPREK